VNSSAAYIRKEDKKNQLADFLKKKNNGRSWHLTQLAVFQGIIMPTVRCVRIFKGPLKIQDIFFRFKVHRQFDMYPQLVVSIEIIPDKSTLVRRAL
jgi:hypothetical protein